MGELPGQERRVLEVYLRANQRVIDSKVEGGQTIPVSILNTLLGVAIWGGRPGVASEPPTLQFLAEQLGISPTTLSTHLRYLGDKYRKDSEGFHLVRTETYVLNRRQKTFSLTAKGKALVDDIVDTLKGNDSPSVETFSTSQNNPTGTIHPNGRSETRYASNSASSKSQATNLDLLSVLQTYISTGASPEDAARFAKTLLAT
jgi:DNA-binding MarR family transcriptional regulator